DAVGVVDTAVYLDHIVFGANAVFYNEQGDAVPVVQLQQRDPQAHRVDLPAPIIGRQIRIPDTQDRVARGTLGVGIHRFGAALVIAERQKINGPLPDDLAITRFHPDLNALLFQAPQLEARIFAPNHDIGIKIVIQI